MSYRYKSRKEKEAIYEQKYGDVPKEYNDRINYIIDKYQMDQEYLDHIVDYRDNMIQNLSYSELDVVIFYENPVGTGRPRSRLVTRKNFHREAMQNPYYIHVYEPGADDDQRYMRRLMADELIVLDRLIYTPVILNYSAYYPIPSEYRPDEVMLSELGLIRPNAAKPDYDNVEKKYSDMYNANVWVDDTTVIDARIQKFYSTLPRVEVRIKYLNMLYNKHQYDKMIKRKLYDGLPIPYLNRKGEITQ